MLDKTYFHMLSYNQAKGTQDGCNGIPTVSSLAAPCKLNQIHIERGCTNAFRMDCVDLCRRFNFVCAPEQVHQLTQTAVNNPRRKTWIDSAT